MFQLLKSIMSIKLMAPHTNPLVREIEWSSCKALANTNNAIARIAINNKNKINKRVLIWFNFLVHFLCLCFSLYLVMCFYCLTDTIVNFFLWTLAVNMRRVVVASTVWFYFERTSTFWSVNDFLLLLFSHIPLFHHCRFSLFVVPFYLPIRLRIVR